MSYSGTDPIGACLVVGGGVSGVQAALDLAAAGIKVFLVERGPAIGGKMAQLDKTFPTNDCAMCILSPKLVECGRHPNIEILVYSELSSLSGEAGNFTARVLRHPTYVNSELCTGCGACTEACIYRNRFPSEFNQGLGKRAPIYILYPQAVPLKAVIDPETCLMIKNRKCTLACVEACEPEAIDFDQVEREDELSVGAVILAPGYEPYDASLSQEFGYGRYDNVVTSLQFERLLSASGPTVGHVTRPSDGREPQRIAFLQCIGSRDQKHPYCSSVCCMYAAKETMLTQEHLPGVQCDVFCMDVRAFGKGFDAYYRRALSQGVRFIRCRISSLKEVSASKDIIVRYQTDEGELREEPYDLVVLSIGMEAAASAKALAERLGVELRPDGFCQTNPCAPVETSRPGVFVCGTFTEPKDIPDSVTEASGAASGVLRLLGRARGTQITEKVYPVEMELDEARPRIGAFICHCGSNIAGVVDVPQVVAYAQTLPDVVHAENLLYACSADSLKLITERIREKGLSRVVVASCTPRTHEPLFQDTLREAGLNPYLFEMANIRDQCSWVHGSAPEQATQKAKALVRMAVARAAVLQPLHEITLGLSHQALVIGGGVAGMTAALSLAETGFPVFLIERERELGGHLRRMWTTVQGEDPQSLVRALAEKVKEHELIEVLTGTTLVKSEGFVGNFETTVTEVDAPRQRMLSHGVIIVATGAEEYRGEAHLLGQHPGVMTMSELERRLAEDPHRMAALKEVVMILCAGTAEKGYCSRICCGVALKNALKVKELNPQANVIVLFREMMTYGFKEELYTRARERGVLFVRYKDETPPRVEAVEGRLEVSFAEPVLREEMTVSPDLVVLATPIVPAEGSRTLAEALKVPLTQEGFFLEAHIKLRPVDFSSEGMFLCGTAHYPKFIDESIAQAQP